MTKATKSPKKSTKKPKKTSQTMRTHIAFVIDRSGSMSGVRSQAFEGINQQINTIKANGDDGGDTRVSYIQFDDIQDVVFENISHKELQNISHDQYIPRGSTALRDATWNAIKLLQANDLKLEPLENTSYLVIVITDGFENASKEITENQLKNEIEALQESGKWTFTYMMGNTDIATARASVPYVHVGNVSSYESPEFTSTSFTMASNGSSAYLASRSDGKTSVKSFYGET